jgi:hypothetical protein
LADSAHGFRGRALDDFLGLGIGELALNSPEARGLAEADVDLVRVVQTTDGSVDFARTRRALESEHGVNSAVLLRFRWQEELRPVLAPLRLLKANGFDFRRKYWACRESCPVASPFSGAAISIAVHIRKGDAACLEFKKGRVYKGRFLQAGEAIPKQHVEVSAYRMLIERLFAQHGHEPFSIHVFSDGYHATFRRMRALPTFREDQERLAKLEEGLHRELLELAEFPNVTVAIGEDENLVRTSVHACATARLVIWNAGAFACRCFTRFNATPGARLFQITRGANDAAAFCRKLLDAPNGMP